MSKDKACLRVSTESHRAGCGVPTRMSSPCTQLAKKKKTTPARADHRVHKTHRPDPRAAGIARISVEKTLGAPPPSTAGHPMREQQAPASGVALHRVRDQLVPFSLVASGVDVPLGWRVLSEGNFFPTNINLYAFHRVHEKKKLSSRRP